MWGRRWGEWVPWVTLGALAASHFSPLVLLSTMLVPRVIYLSRQKHMGSAPHVSDAVATLLLNVLRPLLSFPRVGVCFGQVSKNLNLD